MLRRCLNVGRFHCRVTTNMTRKGRRRPKQNFSLTKSPSPCRRGSIRNKNKASNYIPHVSFPNLKTSTHPINATHASETGVVWRSSQATCYVGNNLHYLSTDAPPNRTEISLPWPSQLDRHVATNDTKSSFHFTIWCSFIRVTMATTPI